MMKGYVVLENGEVFEGVLHGDHEESAGEITFFTGMTGYEQLITDPATKGQIIVFTYPLIGNCGISESALEKAAIHANGLIVSEVSEEGFHYEAQTTLAEYSKKHSVPLLSGIDTRAIVKRIRQFGDMKAVITTDPNHVQFPQAENKELGNLVSSVSTTEMKTYGDGDHHLVLVDHGHESSILNALIDRQYKVTVVPYTISLTEMKQLRPHGVIYSNGPGNPAELEKQLKAVKDIATNYPTFGYGLGHQLLALAFGAKVEKLKCRHQGLSEPVIDQMTNEVLMTSQNHHYIVKEETVVGTGFNVKFININDRTVEGLVHEHYPIMTTQFQPIGELGPSDSESIFYSFLETFVCKGREKVYA